MLIILILFIAVWGSAVIDMAIGMQDCVGDLTWWQKGIVSIIITLGAPFVLITHGIELLLDIIMPEGWDDDDDDKKGY